MTPEGRVKKAIKEWLDARSFWRAGADCPEGEVRGWYYMPVPNGMGVGGIPDFVGSYMAEDADGHYVGPRPMAIEAKAPGEKPTALQLDRHAEMRAANWLVLVVDDVSQLAQLEHYLA